ncbi:MAG: thioredoxin domain-containing protein [Planctomycetota bacterium]|nr:thioredoxin domain-containing protein [Planctomycetota bacterium]
MDPIDSNPPSDPPPDAAPALAASTPRWISALRLLSLAALGIAVYLLYLAITGAKAAGCGDSKALDCTHVIQSKWSSAFGVPVSFFAAWAYVLLLMMSGNLAPRRGANGRFSWGVALLLAAAIASSAAWFLFVQAAILKAFCLYCTIAHALGLIVAGLLFFHAPVRPAPADPATDPHSSRVSIRSAAMFILLGIATVVVMALGAREKGAAIERAGNLAPGIRVGTVLPPATQGASRQVFLMAGKIGVALRPEDYPLRGTPEAPHIVAELFDYTCPHCRTLHALLDQVLERYPGQLGIVLIPVPLESNCNPRIKTTERVHVGGCDLAKLALAVWKADPKAFATFDAWLFESEAHRTPEEARAFASDLLGPEQLERALANPWAAEQLGRNVTLYAHINGGSIPKLLLGSVVVQGRPADAAELFDLFEKELRLTPAATQPAAR